MTHGRRKACCSSGDMVTSLFTGYQAVARRADTQPAGTRAWPGGDVGSPEAPSLAPQRGLRSRGGADSGQACQSRGGGVWLERSGRGTGGRSSRRVHGSGVILRQPGSHHRHCPRDCDPGRQGCGLSRDPAARAPQMQSPRLRASPEAPGAGPACPPGRCVTRPSSPRPPGRHCKPGRSASLEGQAGALPSPQRASRRIGVWPCHCR